MPETVNGLPLHPLVVHAVVVLLPLGALGVIALAVRPAWRHRYGVLVAAITLVATVLIPVATDSGETLEAHVGDPGRHAELGDQLLYFALPLLLAALALAWLGWRGRPALGADPVARPGGGASRGAPGAAGAGEPDGVADPDAPAGRVATATRPAGLAGTPAGPSRAVAAVVAVLALVIAVANLVQVYRVGESGARAAWGNTMSSPAKGEHD
ncbi:DUF2231 domain-containing protein [Plantactinospora siamensis]|uniref:DUF2231 domain-containing protein n=1 Tax=Plantactinospora siamensis TaxID=555372 RepID=A0ABV6P1F2_9ACTN